MKRTYATPQEKRGINMLGERSYNAKKHTHKVGNMQEHLTLLQGL